MSVYIKALAALSLFFSSTIAQAVVINEIRIDQTGADSDEFFELAGDAGESLDGLSYLVIGDASDIEAVVNLSGYQLASDGFFLVAEASFSLSPNIDLITALNFENNDNVTHLLVSNFSGSLHDDVDANNDGMFDQPLWDSIVDSVALLATSIGGDRVYSSTTLGPQNNSSPAHVYRSVDQLGSWQIGEMDAGSTDSPRLIRPARRAVSVPEPSSLLLLLPGIICLWRFRPATKPHALLG